MRPGERKPPPPPLSPQLGGLGADPEPRIPEFNLIAGGREGGGSRGVEHEKLGRSIRLASRRQEFGETGNRWEFHVLCRIFISFPVNRVYRYYIIPRDGRNFVAS